MYKLLDKRLPAMECPDGCGECCGIVSCCEWEMRKIRDYIIREVVLPVRQGITCPLFLDGRCAIYPVRPVVCRLYGHIDNPLMTCPHGYNVNITLQREKRFQGEYRSLSKGQVGLLHGLVYTQKELMELFTQAHEARGMGIPEKSPCPCIARNTPEAAEATASGDPNDPGLVGLNGENNA